MLWIRPYHVNNSSVFAGDHGLESVEEGEKIGSPATPDSAEKFRKTDEPCEAKRESNFAKQGQIQQGPRALARGAPLKKWSTYY